MNYCVTFRNDATVRQILDAVDLLTGLGWTVHSTYTGIGCIIVNGKADLIKSTREITGVSGVEPSV